MDFMAEIISCAVSDLLSSAIHVTARYKAPVSK